MKFLFCVFKIGFTDSARPQHSMVSRCLFDYFSITAPGNKGPPIICGTNNGYHSKCWERGPSVLYEEFSIPVHAVYVDSCTDCNILNVFVSSETAFDRVWDVKITQIVCGSPSRGERGSNFPPKVRNTGNRDGAKMLRK